jgi:NAD(P)-dependent dehydrogenase (short-subunit alcohol dehydrogenase family)
MADTLRFDGEVAVVTGAGRGMGRTHALELARRGAKVVVNDIRGAREISGEIHAAGGEAVADDHSVATAEGGQAIIDLALSTWPCPPGDAWTRWSPTRPATCPSRSTR